MFVVAATLFTPDSVAVNLGCLVHGVMLRL